MEKNIETLVRDAKTLGAQRQREEEAARVLALYKQHGCKHAAEQMNKSISAVYNILGEYHPHKVKAYKRRRAKNANRSDFDPASVLELYKRMQSMRQTAELLGIDKTVLQRIMKQAGYVPKRGRPRKQQAAIAAA